MKRYQHSKQIAFPYKPVIRLLLSRNNFAC